VVFVRKPLTVKKAFGGVETGEGVDRAWPGRGVLYFSRLAAKATSSRLNKVASLPEYKNMTIRNWSTTTKLLALMESKSTGEAQAPRAIAASSAMAQRLWLTTSTLCPSGSRTKAP
jgi:hypothetical protein